MALRPSRPGSMLVGGLVFLVLPYLWVKFSHQRVNFGLVALGIGVALVFLALAVQYRRQRRAAPADSPPAT